MDTKWLIRACYTLPVAAVLGAVVGAAAGGAFWAALVAATSGGHGWSMGDGVYVRPGDGAILGAWVGSLGGLLCGAIGRLFGCPAGWGIGGFLAGYAVGAPLGPFLALVPAAVLAVCGTAVGGAVWAGTSRIPPLKWAARHLHNWDHLTTVGTAPSRAQAEVMRQRLRAQGLSPVVTGADLHRLDRRQPIRIHVPEGQVDAAAGILGPMERVATELEAALAPEGWGTEPEAASAPEGRGDELIGAEAPTISPRDRDRS